MTSILQHLKQAWQYYRPDFSCHFASSAEFPIALELRKTVFERELHRQDQVISLAQEDDFDSKSEHLLCVSNETKQVIGSLRITPAKYYIGSPEEALYGLSKFDETVINHVFIISRAVILPQYRQSLARLFMFLESHRYCLKNDGLFVVICCEPGLVKLYTRLGFKSFASMTTSQWGGYRVPLYALCHDYDYFKVIGSPLYDSAKDLELPQNNAGLKYEEENLQHSPFINFGYCNGVDAQHFELGYLPLFDDLSEEGRDQLLSTAVHVFCKQGDRVLREGMGGREFGMVIKGALKVEISPTQSALLGPGDLFGEIAFLLNVPRTADVFSISDDTEIIFFSQSIIKKLKNTADRESFWLNLSKELAAKVARSTGKMTK